MRDVVALATKHVEVDKDESLVRRPGAQQGPVLDEIADTSGALSLHQNGHCRKFDPEVAELELLEPRKSPPVDAEPVAATLAGDALDAQVGHRISEEREKCALVGYPFGWLGNAGVVDRHRQCSPSTKKIMSMTFARV